MTILLLTEQEWDWVNNYPCDDLVKNAALVGVRQNGNLVKIEKSRHESPELISNEEWTTLCSRHSDDVQ